MKFDKKASDKSSRFTELILKGLRGQADSSDDGLITHRELRQYLLEESKNYAEENNPSFYSNWSESSPTIDRVIAIGSSPISFSKYAKTKLRKLESIEPAFDSDLLETLYSNLTSRFSVKTKGSGLDAVEIPYLTLVAYLSRTEPDVLNRQRELLRSQIETLAGLPKRDEVEE